MLWLSGVQYSGVGGFCTILYSVVENRVWWWLWLGGVYFSGVGGFWTILYSVVENRVWWWLWLGGVYCSGVGGSCTILDSVWGGQSVVEVVVKCCIVVWEVFVPSRILSGEDRVW